ncbi:MAG: SIR2 family protein [Pseudomonadota bacterium]
MQIGLPSWSSLIGELGEQLDYDADIFRSFSNFLALAEYYKLQHQSLASLAGFLEKKWHCSDVSIASSPLHKAIANSGFSRIYTTNFDRWLERAFKHWNRPYRKIVRVCDFGNAANSETEIVKFHGDFEDAETLVLTESNYFDRLEFEHPLDIMLRADILQRPILFIGYSLADVNMRYLFHKLAKIWSDPAVKQSGKESFIFMAQPNPIEQALFNQWGITPVVDENGDGSGLADFLSGLPKPKS